MARPSGGIAGTWHPAGRLSKQPECAAVREGDDGGPERYRLSIQIPRRKVDELLSELAAQTERWITAEDAPKLKMEVIGVPHVSASTNKSRTGLFRIHRVITTAAR